MVGKYEVKKYEMEKLMEDLDQIDKQILEILQEDARITNKDLSRKLGLSPPPTLERVKKLENLGYIKGYAAIIDPKKICLGTTMLVSVSLHQHRYDAIQEFEEAVLSFEEVLECYHVTGGEDFLIKVVCKDIDEFEKFLLEKLSILKNIGKMKTSVVLSTLKKNTAYPVR